VRVKRHQKQRANNGLDPLCRDTDFSATTLALLHAPAKEECAAPGAAALTPVKRKGPALPPGLSMHSGKTDQRE
jgi:hypothetical protein